MTGKGVICERDPAWSQKRSPTPELAARRFSREVRTMSSGSPTAPYTLEITPLLKGDGSSRWAIQLNGKMFERSDRSFRSEQEARTNGHEALERALRGVEQPTSHHRK